MGSSTKHNALNQQPSQAPTSTGFDLAPDLERLFDASVFRSSSGDRLPYRLLKPSANSSSDSAGPNYPLVVFLHGAGERGDDNQVQLLHGVREFATDAVRQRYPAFVVAPQCPQDQQWVDTPWSAPSHRMAAEPTPAMSWTFELIEHLAERFPIDGNRIYLTGMSMGGFGVWEALARRPARFAAGVIVCGGADLATASTIAHVPVWVFHGERDTDVLPQRSREMVHALQLAGGTPRYTEYVDVGHHSWLQTFRDPNMVAWLFAQRLNATDP